MTNTNWQFVQTNKYKNGCEGICLFIYPQRHISYSLTHISNCYLNNLHCLFRVVSFFLWALRRREVMQKAQYLSSACRGKHAKTAHSVSLLDLMCKTPALPPLQETTNNFLSFVILRAVNRPSNNLRSRGLTS